MVQDPVLRSCITQAARVPVHDEMPEQREALHCHPWPPQQFRAELLLSSPEAPPALLPLGTVLGEQVSLLLPKFTFAHRPHSMPAAADVAVEAVLSTGFVSRFSPTNVAVAGGNPQV